MMLGGPVHEFVNDTASLILYVELAAQDSSGFETASDSKLPVLFPYGPSFTLLKVLYSTDEIHYAEYAIDTLAQNSGLPCWGPVTVTSFFFTNDDDDPQQEIGMELLQPVSPNCAAVTTASVSVYDHIETFYVTKSMFRLKEHLPTDYGYPEKKNPKKKRQAPRPGLFAEFRFYQLD